MSDLANWRNGSVQEFDYDKYGNPQLRIVDFANGGSSDTLYGERALANYAPTMNEVPPERRAALMYHGPDDVRESYGGQFGTYLHDLAEREDRTWLGKWMDKGPVAGSALGAGTGWLIGKLLDKVTGEGKVPKSLIGLLGGGVLGGIISHMRKKDEPVYYRGPDPNDPDMRKQGAMYQDPRNFILEKLQAANDVSIAEKMQLAAAVRNMDRNRAEQLKSIVRSAVGFGVGALIAKFLFGAGGLGMAVGGFTTLASQALLNHFKSQPQNNSMFRGPGFYANRIY